MPKKNEVHLYLEPDEMRFVKVEANKNLRSLTAQVRYLIQQAMEAAHKERGITKR